MLIVRVGWSAAGGVGMLVSEWVCGVWSGGELVVDGGHVGLLVVCVCVGSPWPEFLLNLNTSKN